MTGLEVLLSLTLVAFLSFNLGFACCASEVKRRIAKRERK